MKNNLRKKDKIIKIISKIIEDITEARAKGYTTSREYNSGQIQAYKMALKFLRYTTKELDQLFNEVIGE